MPRKRDLNPRKRPNQRRSKATVDAVLQAAANVLSKEGYEAATTNRVAKEAGVSVGSVYQYFPSREALVAELIDRQADRMLGMLTDQLSEVATAPLEDAIRTMIHALFDALAEDAPLNAVLLQSLPLVGRIDRLREWESRAAKMVQVYLTFHRDRIAIDDLETGALLLVHLADTTAMTFTTYHEDRLRTGKLKAEITDLVTRYVLGSAR